MKSGSRLRARMIEDMELRRLAPGTQRAYVTAVRNLAKHYRRSPDQITEQEVRQFFLELIDRRYAPDSARR